MEEKNTKIKFLKFKLLIKEQDLWTKKFDYKLVT